MTSLIRLVVLITVHNIDAVAGVMLLTGLSKVIVIANQDAMMLPVSLVAALLNINVTPVTTILPYLDAATVVTLVASLSEVVLIAASP